jgi:hypothetical protein
MYFKRSLYLLTISSINLFHLPYTFTDYLTSIASFALNSIVNLLHSSASLLACILQPSRFPQNITHISSATSETFDIELLDFCTYFLLTYLSYTDILSHYIPPMLRVDPESSGISDYAGD